MHILLHVQNFRDANFEKMFGSPTAIYEATLSHSSASGL